MIDTDPQCSLTLIFKSESEVDQIEEHKTFYDILCNTPSDMKRKIAHSSLNVYEGAIGKIDLIPSHVQLIRPMIASMLAGVNRGQAFRFEQMAVNFDTLLCSARSMYDLVVIDTNPSGNIATFLAVKHADYIIAPVSSDRFSIRGIALMQEVFAHEFEWLKKEPWRLIPIINNVVDDVEAARVRAQLKSRAKGEFGEEALIEYVRHSGFLEYNERKLGFAAQRTPRMFNSAQHRRMTENLARAAKELVKKTGLGDEEDERRDSTPAVQHL
jgi:cellulose biosynthesis protein BcsQ